MICNPGLLIADEPTTALDVTIQAQILRLMRQLRDEHGTSIILITHNMGIVAEACDEVAVMYMGRVVEAGTVRQIFAAPQHPYTRALLRSVPVLGMPPGTELTSIPGSTPDASIHFDHCAFEPRCPHACPACRSGFPPVYEYEPGHFVHCFAREEDSCG
jgi:peptide/nickel transport system ATP-binding protein